MKRFASQDARITSPARAASLVRVVATLRQAQVNPEFNSLTHDLSLGHSNQGCVNDNSCGSLDAGFGSEVSHPLKCLNKFRPAVGIARVVDCVHSDKNIGSTNHFRIRESKREENRVACGHIRHGNGTLRRVLAPMFWNLHITCESRPAKYPQVNLHRPMLPRLKMLGDQTCRPKLDCVALAIIKGEAVALKSLFASYSEAGGGVKPAAQETNRFFRGVMVQPFQYRFG